MESRAHFRLKQLAAAWLVEAGWAAVGMEVSGPIGRFRVDVAGWTDRLTDRPEDRLADRRTGSKGRRVETAFIECKQTRGDFFRDRRRHDRLIIERDRLKVERERLERDELPRVEPELRRDGSSLFPGLEGFDFQRAQHRGYRRTIARLRRVNDMVHGETKFDRAERYRLADRMWIAAPVGLLRKRDLPPGWGLLECPRGVLTTSAKNFDPTVNLFGDSVLIESVAAPSTRRSAARFQQRMLRNIAVAASRQSLRAAGVQTYSQQKTPHRMHRRGVS